MARIKDMTSGKPVRLILVFAFPILIGNMLQQLYSLIDSLIIGQLLGVTALTAVSASGWLDWAVLSIPMGLAQGYSSHAAQCYGGKRYDELKRTVAQSYLISTAVTIILEIFSQTLLHPVLTWMNSPEETIRLTERYLRIIYAGLPVVMCLNIFSGFLHALGNSRTPLLALACSSAVNISLDWWFVGSLGLGTNGGAYATVIAQAVSAAICFAAVLRIPELRPRRKDYRPDKTVIPKLIKLGFPIAFQNLIISLGGLVLQGVVNAFGFVFMAGYNAASRLQGLIEPILSLFIRDEAELAGQVLAIGYDFLRIMAAGLPMLYLLFVYRSTLQGLGDTVIPMLSGFIELALRVGTALLLPMLLGYWGVYIAEIAAWIGAGIFLIIGCYYRLRVLRFR